MSEPLTLEPIEYVTVRDERGAVIGRRVPDLERERFDSGNGLSSSPGDGVHTLDPQPVPLDHLEAEIDKWLYYSAALRGLFRGLYAAHPMRATRLALRVLEGARDGSLQSPDRFLAARLHEEK